MSNEVKKSGFTITKEQFAKDYVIIDKEGIISGIKATGQNNSYYNEDIGAKSDNYGRTILVNLKAIESRKIPAVQSLFKGRTEIDLVELKNLTVVHPIHLNDDQEAPRLPIRNQEVSLQFFYATNKDGSLYKDQNDNKVFNSAQMQVPEPVKASGFVFEEVEVEEKVEVPFGQE